MKKIITAVALLCSFSAFAGEQASGVTAQATQATTAASQASNAGNQQDINFNAPDVTHAYTQVGGTETIRNVPNPSAPALTTSNDTCMGSTSGSITIAGLGIGGGSTWVDTNCKRLKNSRELWNMGMKAAALALLCKDAENKEALEITGFVCPSKKDDSLTVAPAVNKVVGQP